MTTALFKKKVLHLKEQENEKTFIISGATLNWGREVELVLMVQSVMI